MARRLSDKTRREIERQYPHHVEVSIPRDGLAPGTTSWMDRWCMEYCRGTFNSPSSFQGEGTHHTLLWCFADPDDADRFARQFRGTRRSLG